MNAHTRIEERDAAGQRVAEMDWPRVERDLDAFGAAILPKLLSPEECRAIAMLYSDDARFRSKVVMARHGFGRGEYKYFDYPLPELIGGLRGALYARLAPVANRWNERMSLATHYPAEHREFLAACHAAGQRRPTPLLLQYDPGDFNCLHQDLYGDLAFPLQVAVLLSEPAGDFTGGEFVLTEQRPRMQCAPKSCRYPKATESLSPSTIARSKARAGPIGSTCATASVACARGEDIRSEIIFHDGK